MSPEAAPSRRLRKPSSRGGRGLRPDRCSPTCPAGPLLPSLAILKRPFAQTGSRRVGPGRVPPPREGGGAAVPTSPRDPHDAQLWQGPASDRRATASESTGSGKTEPRTPNLHASGGKQGRQAPTRRSPDTSPSRTPALTRSRLFSPSWKTGSSQRPHLCFRGQQPQNALSLRKRTLLHQETQPGYVGRSLAARGP